MDGRDGLTTVAYNRDETSITSVWLSLPDKQIRTKADKCMTCFTAH